MVWIWNTDPSIKHACIIAILKSIYMILAPIPSYFFLKKLLLSKQMPNQLDLKETEFQMDSRNKAEHTLTLRHNMQWIWNPPNRHVRNATQTLTAHCKISHQTETAPLAEPRYRHFNTNAPTSKRAINIIYSNYNSKSRTAVASDLGLP